MAVHSSQELSEGAYLSAAPKIRAVMLHHAGERVQAASELQRAQQQRVTQITTLLFAATAFSTQIAITASAPRLVSISAAAAALMFALGGIVGLSIIGSQNLFLRGEDPEWWANVTTLTGLSEEKANAWMFGQMQVAIDSIRSGTAKRARYLTLALYFGLAGSVLIALGAFLTLPPM